MGRKSSKQARAKAPSHKSISSQPSYQLNSIGKIGAFIKIAAPLLLLSSFVSGKKRSAELYSSVGINIYTLPKECANFIPAVGNSEYPEILLFAEDNHYDGQGAESCIFAIANTIESNAHEILLEGNEEGIAQGSLRNLESAIRKIYGWLSTKSLKAGTMALLLQRYRDLLDQLLAKYNDLKADSSSIDDIDERFSLYLEQFNQQLADEKDSSPESGYRYLAWTDLAGRIVKKKDSGLSYPNILKALLENQFRKPSEEEQYKRDKRYMTNSNNDMIERLKQVKEGSLALLQAGATHLLSYKKEYEQYGRDAKRGVANLHSYLWDSTKRFMIFKSKSDELFVSNAEYRATDRRP